MTHYDRELLRHGDVSKLVSESIRAGTREWEALVPHHVRDQIKALNLLGHRPREARGALGEGGGSGGSGDDSDGRKAGAGAGKAPKKAGAGAA